MSAYFAICYSCYKANKGANFGVKRLLKLEVEKKI